MSESGITLGVTSAIDLTLKGTVGSFSVGSGNEKKSLDVKYLLTHVSLNFSEGMDEKLLKELAPVREIFDPKDLDFDEIMQRDIDDSRVSNELIPYILDDRTNDLIKFFPPIVVIVLPISNNRNKPEALYPKVSIEDVEKEEFGVKTWKITRSGDIGSEVFEFRQPIIQNKPSSHDLVSLGLNTSKCRMIIVDGQHRAMSLLALYRNLKDGWSDAKRQPFKKYYDEWTDDYIRKFDLNEINLPLIICTIPDLDTSYSSDYNLKKAARSIFLTLNKTARKVSRTRNLLLDDNDLISSFMRKTLGVIKDADNRSEQSLSIQNIELDNERNKISTPIAISGVSHLHYIIEHLLMDGGDIIGVSSRSGRFGGRTYFGDALSRLDAKNTLGSDECDKTSRDSFSEETENKLGIKYQEIYGKIIVTFLNNFKPYESHNKATLSLKETLRVHDPDLVSMLFEGQGVIGVFNEHRANLKKKLSGNDFVNDVPRIQAIVDELDNTEARIKIRVDELYKVRSEKYLNECVDKVKFNIDGDIADSVKSEINKIYDNVYKTVAFQSAAICGFYKVYEKVSKDFSGDYDLDLSDIFGEYLDQLNKFFAPKSFSGFKKILSVLAGRTEGDDAGSLEIARNSNDSFRGVVLPSEMNPDNWPKYRYLILEIWKPTDINILSEFNKELDFCRNQVFKDLYERKKKTTAQEKNITEETLDKDDLKLIFDESFDNYKAFLGNFGRASDIQKTGFKEYISDPDSEIYDNDEGAN